MTDRISKILQYLEKDIEAGNLVDRLPESVERAIEEVRTSGRTVDVNKEILGPTVLDGSLEEAEEWIRRQKEER